MTIYYNFVLNFTSKKYLIHEVSWIKFIVTVNNIYKFNFIDIADTNNF